MSHVLFLFDLVLEEVLLQVTSSSPQDPQHTPLLRLAWNKQDPNYLATVAMDACEVIILDVRVPCTPVARLNNHRACVNGIAWAPHRYTLGPSGCRGSRDELRPP